MACRLFSSFSSLVQVQYQKIGASFIRTNYFYSPINHQFKGIKSITFHNNSLKLKMDEATTTSGETNGTNINANANIHTPTKSIPEENLILFPPIRKGMTILDKSAFNKTIKVPKIILSGQNIHNQYKLKTLKPYFLKNQKFRSIQDGNDGIGTKTIYLNPDLVPNPEELLTKFKDVLLNENEESTIDYETVEFTYENWNWDQLFKSILPDDADKVSGFTIVGHLVHLNLRDHVLPYKSVIGQILLDNIPNIKTVVNKTNTIDNTYRNFQMEVIAGEPNTIVKVKENNIEFEFDFATVYWNSRLSSEHGRIVDYLKMGQDVLFDVFAGVGPFAIPAAKQKKCQVYANDLNPESYKWLNHNVKKRKVADFVKTFSKDGKEFIREDASSILKAILLKETESPLPTFHFTLNLPAMAVEFLNSFWNLLNGLEKKSLPDFTIMVHVYCFVRALEAGGGRAMALDLVKEKLCYDLPKDNVVEVFYVRNVAPLKNMFRVTFRLPNEILFEKAPEASDDTPSEKRLKLDVDIDIATS